MRNNTKLKYLLCAYDINLSMNEKEITAMFFDKQEKISFLITGTSITNLVDKAIKLKPKKK